MSISEMKAALISAQEKADNTQDRLSVYHERIGSILTRLQIVADKKEELRGELNSFSEARDTFVRRFGGVRYELRQLQEVAPLFYTARPQPEAIVDALTPLIDQDSRNKLNWNAEHINSRVLPGNFAIQGLRKTDEWLGLFEEMRSKVDTASEQNFVLNTAITQQLAEWRNL